MGIDETPTSKQIICCKYDKAETTHKKYESYLVSTADYIVI